MPKEVVVAGLSNKIEYATTNGKGLITGKREDITDQTINAVFMHLKTEYERKHSGSKGAGYEFESGARLMYLAPNTKVVWIEGE